MRIGALATAAGVSVDTIRYYERLGLLPRAARTPGGYREFPDGAVTRLAVIRNAVRFGFPLKEVARFLKVRDAGGAPCDQVRAFGQHLLAEMDEKIAELVATRKSMDATLRDWDRRLARAGAGRRAHLLEAVPAEDAFSPRRRTNLNRRRNSRITR